MPSVKFIPSVPQIPHLSMSNIWSSGYSTQKIGPYSLEKIKFLSQLCPNFLHLSLVHPSPVNQGVTQCLTGWDLLGYPLTSHESCHQA